MINTIIIMSWLSDQTLNSLMSASDVACTLQKDLCCFSDSCYAHLLKNHAYFGGVFPADKLPTHKWGPVSYIINSDPASKPGEHWLAYYQDDGVADFFDSYGRHPTAYKHIYPWFEQAPIPITTLKVRLQGDNPYCGAYTYYFLMERPYHASMHDVFFENPAHRFNYAARNDNYTPQMVKDYLGPNDRYVFHYLYRNVQHLLQ